MNVDDLRQLTAGPRRPRWELTALEGFETLGCDARGLLQQTLGLCVPQHGPRGAAAALGGLADLYPEVGALRVAEQVLKELGSADSQRELAALPQLKSDPLARYLAKGAFGLPAAAAQPVLMHFYSLAQRDPGLTHGATLCHAAADLGQSCTADPLLFKALKAGDYEDLLTWVPPGKLELSTVLNRTAAIRAAFGLQRVCRGVAGGRSGAGGGRGKRSATQSLQDSLDKESGGGQRNPSEPQEEEEEPAAWSYKFDGLCGGLSRWKALGYPRDVTTYADPVAFAHLLELVEHADLAADNAARLGVALRVARLTGWSARILQEFRPGGLATLDASAGLVRLEGMIYNRRARLAGQTVELRVHPEVIELIQAAGESPLGPFSLRIRRELRPITWVTLRRVLKYANERSPYPLLASDLAGAVWRGWSRAGLSPERMLLATAQWDPYLENDFIYLSLPSPVDLVRLQQAQLDRLEQGRVDLAALRSGRGFAALGAP